MMPEPDAARLQAAYRRESASLLRYARSAAPYAAGADKKRRDTLFRVADEAEAALDGLAAFLTTHRLTVPFPGAFPPAFTDYNCVAVGHLLPKVAADVARSEQALAADAAAATDPAARDALAAVAAVATRHRAELAAG